MTESEKAFGEELDKIEISVKQKCIEYCRKHKVFYNIKREIVKEIISTHQEVFRVTDKLYNKEREKMKNMPPQANFAGEDVYIWQLVKTMDYHSGIVHDLEEYLKDLDKFEKIENKIHGKASK